MFLTNLLLAKRPKAKLILVVMQSQVTGHKYLQIRERLADKLEGFRFDPYLSAMAYYKELCKCKSIR